MSGNINTNLPTKEEFFESELNIDLIPDQWSEPKYQCPKCDDGGMCKNLFKVLTSYPAKYEYQCNKCGHTEFHFK